MIPITRMRTFYQNVMRGTTDSSMTYDNAKRLYDSLALLKQNKVQMKSPVFSRDELDDFYTHLAESVDSYITPKSDESLYPESHEAAISDFAKKLETDDYMLDMCVSVMKKSMNQLQEKDSTFACEQFYTDNKSIIKLDSTKQALNAMVKDLYDSEISIALMQADYAKTTGDMDTFDSSMVLRNRFYDVVHSYENQGLIEKSTLDCIGQKDYDDYLNSKQVDLTGVTIVKLEDEMTVTNEVDELAAVTMESESISMFEDLVQLRIDQNAMLSDSDVQTIRTMIVDEYNQLLSEYQDNMALIDSKRGFAEDIDRVMLDEGFPADTLYDELPAYVSEKIENMVGHENAGKTGDEIRNQCDLDEKETVDSYKADIQSFYGRVYALEFKDWSDVSADVIGRRSDMSKNRVSIVNQDIHEKLGPEYQQYYDTMYHNKLDALKAEHVVQKSDISPLSGIDVSKKAIIMNDNSVQASQEMSMPNVSAEVTVTKEADVTPVVKESTRRTVSIADKLNELANPDDSRGGLGE